MNILFLSIAYPNKYTTSFGFVKTLVDALADRGNHCYVIAPYNISRSKKLWHGLEKTEMKNGGSVTVSRPNHFTFSNWKIGPFVLSEISTKLAIRRALRKMRFKPDVAYGHFWICGWNLYEYAKKNGIPLYVATGESIISSFLEVTPDMKPFSEYVKGVICVSSKNKEESIELGLTTEEKCLLAPNSINNNLFRKLDRSEARKQLNFPEDIFIVAFVGWFKHTKGPERVAAAIKTITKGEKVYSIFIGAGTEENPECENILFKNKIMNQDVPLYLNAADAFVLPTLNEGCCNSIVEAMACGLPIISSDLPFNWDILNDNNSIMVNPNSIEEIAQAIVKLRDDRALRLHLSEGALHAAKDLTIEKRAAKIEEFIKQTMDK